MFVGREYELSLLHGAIGSDRAELVILYGRRRVGKSSMLARLADRPGALYFEALQGVPRKQQIAHFMRQLADQTRTPLAVALDWQQAFDVLSFHVTAGEHYVVFDELPWMASGKSDLVALLKYFWDNRWKANSGLTLVLCGSVAAFMLNHVVHSTALHNRKTLEIELPPLTAAEALPMFRDLRSHHEAARFLMVFGGIPKYLEQIDPAVSLRDNLDRLCFQRHGFFLDEFETIFKEQFRSTRSYEAIVRTLAQGSGSKADLARRSGIAEGGGLTTYVENLERAGFVRTFSPATVLGVGRKTRRIVLWDEWLRFYFTWMEPHLEIIRANTRPGLVDHKAGDGLDSYFGLAFERLCMRNLPRVLENLGIDLHQVLGFGPFFRQPGRGSGASEGAQIDVLVRRRGDVLTLLECKLSARPVGTSVLDEVRRKIRVLKAPSTHTVERVLLAPGGVTSGVVNSGFFHRIAGIEVLF
jgi:uncharacterized protein